MPTLNYLTLRTRNGGFPLWNMGSSPSMLGVLDSRAPSMERESPVGLILGKGWWREPGQAILTL